MFLTFTVNLTNAEHIVTLCKRVFAGTPGRESLYRRMVSEARGDLFVKATCQENSDQSLTLFLTE